MTSEINNQQKKICAILTMRMMLEDYSKSKNISFKEALLEFSLSKTYEMLFDFTTGLWKEGPNYIQYIYEKEITMKSRIAS